MSCLLLWALGFGAGTVTYPAQCLSSLVSPLAAECLSWAGEMLPFSLTCKTGAAGAEQCRWEVPQLIASAEWAFTEPLVIQTGSGSCSSEAWNCKWQLAFRLSPSEVGERTLCKTSFMQEFFYLNTFLKVSNFGNAQTQERAVAFLQMLHLQLTSLGCVPHLWW